MGINKIFGNRAGLALTATSDLMIGTKSAATTGKAIAMAMVFG